MRALLLGLPLALSSCVVNPTAVELATPQALSCAQLPELRAELHASGVSDPCPLNVDVIAGTTSGSCNIPTGVVRTITIDWIIDDNQTRVVLAQVRRDIDVTRAEEESTFVIAEEDIVVDDCVTIDGGATQLVNGRAAPVCDLDNDNISNVAESCGGTSPLGAL